MLVRCLIALVALSCTTPAAGATYVVNSLADPGNGVCDAAECTLREAVDVADGDGAFDTIMFSVTGTIKLQSEIVVNGANTVAIEGPGTRDLVISGENETRIFNVANVRSSLWLRNLTLQKGNARNDTQYPNGGAVLTQFASYLLMEDVRIVDNQAEQGAGVFLLGTGARIARCEFSGNRGQRAAAIVMIGEDSTDNVIFINNTISGNVGEVFESAVLALANPGQIIGFWNVTVANNSGGQYAADFLPAGGTVSVANAIFADNDSDFDVRVQSGIQVRKSVAERISGTPSGTGNAFGVDPQLLPLTFVGDSKTRIHPFTEGPARDLVQGCTNTESTDQLGNPRQAGPACDAGAFELPLPELLADWTFDELPIGEALTAGRRVADTSGSGRDARAEDAADVPTAVPGRLGGTALALQASSDRIVFDDGHVFGDGGPVAGSDIDFDVADSFTLEALVRIPEGSKQVSTLIAKGSIPTLRSWRFGIDNGALLARVGDGQFQSQVSGTRAINDGAWHHVAFVRDAWGHQLRVYVDRELDGSAADATGRDLFTGEAIVVGALGNGQQQLEGELDFVRVTRGVLPVAELVQVPMGPDLSVAIDDGTDVALPGALLEYTVTIANDGDEDAAQAIVGNTLPPEITGATWTCTPQGGATCTATGGGALNDTIDIPVGATVTYSVAASVTTSPFESIEYTVSVATNGVQPEQQPADNTATDVDLSDPLLGDGFEDPLPVVAASAGKLLVDVARLDTTGLDIRPRAVARTLDGHGRPNGWIHARRIDGRLQARASFRHAADVVWTVGDWVDVRAEAKASTRR